MTISFVGFNLIGLFLKILNKIFKQIYNLLVLIRIFREQAVVS